MDYSSVNHILYMEVPKTKKSLSKATQLWYLYNPLTIHRSIYLWYLINKMAAFTKLIGLYHESREICHIYELGVMQSKPTLFEHLGMRAFNLVVFKLLGSQRWTWNKVNRYAKCIAIDGNWLFESERRDWSAVYMHVYISEWLNIKGLAPANEEGSFVQRQDGQFLSDIAESINNQLINRAIDTKLYSYKTFSLFYNGRLNAVRYTRRRNRALNNISTYGILELIDLRSSTVLTRRINILNNRIKNINKFATIDTFFEWQRFRHSTWFELVWAAYPTVIIFHILIPSLYLLYSLDDEVDPDFTVKVIGHQWYWSYEFDNWVEVETDIYKFVSFKFNSNIVQDEDLAFGAKRLLEVDKRLVLPVNFFVRFVITSSDVLHAWAVPQLGIKSDAVPGRLNQFLAFITCPGVYYGQCSELCGAAHGFMPIVVQGVPYHTFVNWLQESNFC